MRVLRLWRRAPEPVELPAVAEFEGASRLDEVERVFEVAVDGGTEACARSQERAPSKDLGRWRVGTRIIS